MNPEMPEVMFLPLAAVGIEGLEGLDAGVLCRRLPDFVHQALNQGHAGPTGMLEVQSPPEEGPTRWVSFDAVPTAEEAFDLLPEGESVSAVVSGELSEFDGKLHVEFHCFFVEDLDEQRSSKIGGVIPADDPLAGLLPLVSRLAGILELPYCEPPRELLTRNGRAFWRFLQGLDNATLLSGDLEIAVPGDRVALMQPFAEALACDPRFGLALRVAQSTAAMAFADRLLGREEVKQFLDRCFAISPADGEGCVAVAEQLADLGDDRRAADWLELAARLDPPPPRALENLGILCANRGETDTARRLWLRGVEIDGHPDFFAHLARLSFAEKKLPEAWDLLRRGLWRLWERNARPGEWDEDAGASILLQYLHEHLDGNVPPADLVGDLLRLEPLLEDMDSIAIGLCLETLGRKDEARRALERGLDSWEGDFDLRDQGVRALLRLSVAGFERRFDRAARQATSGRKPADSLPTLKAYRDLQKEFWPALYYSARAKVRLGLVDEALDLLDEALKCRPWNRDLLLEAARLFDGKGNPKRALELIDKALERARDDPELCCARISFLLHLGREDAARDVLDEALRVNPADAGLRRLKRRLAARRR
ncbi:MAG: hypothetical protein Fur0037_00970 [Planctomycetota bacterium]